MNCVEKNNLDVIGVEVYKDSSILLPFPYNVHKRHVRLSDITITDSPVLHAALSPMNGEFEMKDAVSVSVNTLSNEDGYFYSFDFDMLLEKNIENVMDCAEQLRGVNFHVVFHLYGGNRVLVYAIPFTSNCDMKDVVNGRSSLLTLSFSLSSFSNTIYIHEDSDM